MPTDLIAIGEVSVRLKVTRSCLRAWRLRGYGPPWVKLSRSLVRYPAAELEAWIAERRSDRREPR